MNEEALQLLYDEIASTYDVGSIEDFKSYLDDDNNRSSFYEEVIAPNYDVESLEDFESIYGLKKKEEEVYAQDPTTELQLEAGGLESSEESVQPLSVLNRNRQPSIVSQKEEDTAIERMFGKNEVTDFFGDLYRAGAQGQAQGATVDDALNLFAQGQDISQEDLQEYISAVQNMNAQGVSEEMQDFSKIYEKEGKGVIGFMKGVASNPTVIPQLFTSSVSAMINKASLAAGATGAGGGALVGAVPGAIAGGIAGMSGALETGLAYTEFLQEELGKKDLSFDDKGIREILQDPEAMNSIRNRALGRGFTIAAIDAMTGGLAAGVTRKAATRLGSKLAGVAAGGTVEALGGATGEAAARLVTGQEMDVAEIGFEGIAGTATAPITVGFGLLKPPSYAMNDGKATRKDIQTLLATGTPDQIAAVKISVKNDKDLYVQSQNKKSDAILIREIEIANPGINEEDKARLLVLEKSAQTLTNSPLKSAKNNLDNVNEEIDTISKKYLPTQETILTTEQEIRESLAAKGVENPIRPNYTLSKINTKNAAINLDLKSLDGPDSFEISTKNYKETEGVEGATIIGYVRDRDFPGEKKKTTRGEVFILQVNEKGKGIGTSIMLDALRLMKENGTKTVKFTSPSKEGKPFNDTLIRKGYIKLLKVSDRTGTSEYEITDKVLEETMPRDYNSERFELLSEEDKVLANRIKDETKRNKFVNNKTIKTNEGIRINETEAAEKALADPNSDEATLIAATRKMEEPTAPFNAAAISDVQEDLIVIEENNIKGIGVSGSAQVTLKYKNQVNDASSSVQEKKTDVSENEQITYTLPSTPKEAAKDFDVIDNRNQKADLEIDEDGAGNWYVQNNKTGRNIAASTKKEAQFLSKPENAETMWDYGDGDIIFSKQPISESSQDFVAETEKTQTKKEKTKETNAKRKDAIRNIKKGKLGVDSSAALLTRLFAMRSELIPSDQVKSYDELLENISKREAVLSLEKSEQLSFKAETILNAVEAKLEQQDSQVEEVKESDFDVDTESKRIADIKVTINEDLDEYSKGLAKEINDLTAEDVEGLTTVKKDGSKDYSLIKQLEKVKDNIENGFVPKKAQDIITQVRSNRKSDTLLKPFTNLKRTKILENFRKAIYQVEKMFGGMIAKNYISNRVRNNPKFQIDDILGNFNSKTIYNNTIRPLAEAFSTNETETKKLSDKIGKALNFLSFGKANPTFLSVARPHNKFVRDQYMIRLYQLQREHLTNPGNNKAASGIDFLNSTIEAALEGEVLNVMDLEILQSLKKEFEVDGEIDNNKIEKNFTKDQKEALKLLDEVNNSLAPKALTISSQIRGNKIDLLNNYSHHIILRDFNANKENLQSRQGEFINPSTKSRTTQERTDGSKPISFDPFLSATRGVQETLLDYYMTLPIRELQQTLSKLEKKMAGDTKVTNEDRMALKALRTSVNESLEKVFHSTFTDYSAADVFFDKVRKLGYQAALASAPRAVAEFTSNFAFAISSNPNGFMSGVNDYMGIIRNNDAGVNFLNNVGSTETLKLYNKDQMTTKNAEIDLFKQVSSKKGQAKSQLGNAINYISGFGGRQLTQFVDKLANNLLSAPDQWISRPLYFGEFAAVFQKETGIKLTEKDMMEISDGSSKYLGEEYKSAIEKSAISADKQSIMMATSKNPFNSIDKLQSKPNDSLTRRAWRMANGYMANFSLFEYTTARAAVNALFNEGEISSQQAMGILTGVTMRMSLYAVLYSVIANQADKVFGAPEDEDAEDLDKIGFMLTRQLTGSIGTLLSRGTLGNIPNIPITMGLEAINEKYLQSLRDDEKFDPFKHAMVYSQLGTKDLAEKNLNDLFIGVFSGPYGPLVKSAERGKTLITRSLTNKTKKGRDRAKDELTKRMSYEALGNLGVLPFYKDVRRIVNKIYFEDYAKTKKGTGNYSKSELRKINPALYKRLYGPNSPEARLRKQKRNLEKKRKTNN